MENNKLPFYNVKVFKSADVDYVNAQIQNYLDKFSADNLRAYKMSVDTQFHNPVTVVTITMVAVSDYEDGNLNED